MSKIPNPILKRFLWGLVALLALVTVVLSVVVGWKTLQRRSFSDDIFPAPQDDGSISFGVRPNLRDAQVVIPDRPHNLDEVPTLELREDFERKRTFYLSTNSMGLRSPSPTDGLPMEIETPAPGYRIVCLGASITFGWGVPWKESYPARLQEELGVEVINAGAPAADLMLLAEWAKEHILELDPDLVVFNVRPAYMDPSGPEKVLQQAVAILQQAAPEVQVGVVMPPLSTFDLQTQDILRGYPRLGWGREGDGQPAVEADAQRAAQAVAPVPLLDLTPVFRDAQYRYQPASADETAVLLQRNGTTQRLVQVPARTLLVEAPAVVQGMAVPILEAFDRDQDMHEPYFFDGGHPDSDGYALYAREVARWIRSQEWLPGGR